MFRILCIFGQFLALCFAGDFQRTLIGPGAAHAHERSMKCLVVGLLWEIRLFFSFFVQEQDLRKQGTRCIFRVLRASFGEGCNETVGYSHTQWIPTRTSSWIVKACEIILFSLVHIHTVVRVCFLLRMFRTHCACMRKLAGRQAVVDLLIMHCKYSVCARRNARILRPYGVCDVCFDSSPVCFCLFILLVHLTV